MIKYLLPLIVLAGCLPKKDHRIPEDTLTTPVLTAQKTEVESTGALSETISVPYRYSTGDHFLSLSEVSVSKQDDLIRLEFDVRWDASWRSGQEYDAAWIFLKGKTRDGLWQHQIIEDVSAQIRPYSPAKNSEGIVDIAPDGVGMMLYRQKDGQGDNHWTVTLTLPDETIKVQEYRVFGLEMVHVTSGPFEAGTLKGERDRREVLTQGAGGAPYDPFFTYSAKAANSYGGVFRVGSENPIEIGPKDGNLYWIDANIPGTNTFSGVPEGTLEQEFPKGFKGFYQMKYEVSQQEYCDFLNTLTPKQQRARDITAVMEFDRPIKDYRNEIRMEEDQYTTSRPNRPCNFISWLDGQAYADWAGLRHMTELEFEKSCRGPLKAVYREYVWGVNEIDEPDHMVYVNGFYQNNEITYEESGKEVTDGNIHASMFSYRNFIDVCTREGNFYDPSSTGCRSFKGGDGGRGPVGKGIFGRDSRGDRIKAGGSYYGAMELGGNLQEPVVTVGHPSGRRFSGTHGNGTLTEEGFADNSDWQPINGAYAFGGRGGCWKFHENHARISDRFKGLRTDENRRASHIGFRGVRTTWND